MSESEAFRQYRSRMSAYHNSMQQEAEYRIIKLLERIAIALEKIGNDERLGR